MFAMLVTCGYSEVMETNSIYKIPKIAHHMKLWKQAPQGSEASIYHHNEWVRLAKAEQVKRGQRTNA